MKYFSNNRNSGNVSNIKKIIQGICLLRAITKLKPSPYATGVCLEGDTTLRLNAALKLYNEGKISSVIVSGGVNQPEFDRFPAQEMKKYLVTMGLPEDVVWVEENSMNTRDHAYYVCALGEEMSVNELIIITSGYHLLRAYLTILKVVIEKDRPFVLYGYSASTLAKWFSKSLSENRYRILLFLNEIKKIRIYQNDLLQFEDAWQYIFSLNSTKTEKRH